MPDIRDNLLSDLALELLSDLVMEMHPETKTPAYEKIIFGELIVQSYRGGKNGLLDVEAALVRHSLPPSKTFPKKWIIFSKKEVFNSIIVEFVCVVGENLKGARVLLEICDIKVPMIN